jgi:hypothetical protein
MDDDKHEERETADEAEVDDLDLDESEAEAVKGGSGGDYDNGMQGGIKHPH